MTPWKMKTLKDHLDAARMHAPSALLRAKSSEPARGPAGEVLRPNQVDEPENPLRPCPCGRRQQADMMADVSMAPPATREAWGLVPDADFICDGCLNGIHLRGLATREEILEVLGAPAPLLQFVRVALLRSGAASRG
ncbi:hypothetical protein QEG98_28190 [Myxococcus sp. MxC21-1]|uniref:hypothetical protein n=1 Tax=Myxococcus sp. MxC21-1 TaxID=3041439 RepID=UPI0029318E63|nr:hypothetical protein [Myxococcus sp. MxC21-1]WNZ59886.1 hypothetical protein QEG98_28190 [Myxococcus sp. MxC21-1]